jgi:hypothetical protein
MYNKIHRTYPYGNKIWHTDVPLKFVGIGSAQFFMWGYLEKTYDGFEKTGTLKHYLKNNIQYISQIKNDVDNGPFVIFDPISHF